MAVPQSVKQLFSELDCIIFRDELFAYDVSEQTLALIKVLYHIYVVSLQLLLIQNYRFPIEMVRLRLVDSFHLSDVRMVSPYQNLQSFVQFGLAMIWLKQILDSDQLNRFVLMSLLCYRNSYI